MKRLALGILLFSSLFIEPLAGETDQDQIILHQGIQSFTSGNYGSAILLLRRLSARDGEIGDTARYYIALGNFHLGRYDDATYELNSFISSCRTPGLCHEARFWLGETYYRGKKYFPAIEEYKRFTDKNPKGEKALTAHTRIAEFYHQEKRYDEAVIEWDKAILSCSDRDKNVTAHIGKNNTLLAGGLYRKAIENLVKLAGVAMSAELKLLTLLKLGEAYFRDGDHERAMTTFSQIPEKELVRAPFRDIYYYRSEAAFKKNDSRAAERDLALYFAAGEKSAWLNRGRLLQAQILAGSDRKEDALKILTTLRNTLRSDDPDFDDASVLYAQLLLNTSPKLAITVCLALLDNPRFTRKREANLIAARASSAIGEYRRADDLYRTYLKEFSYDTNLDQIYLAMAENAMAEGNFELALDYIDKVKNENPLSKTGDKALLYQALVLIKKKEYVKAADHLKKAISVAGSDEQYQLHLLLVRTSIERDILPQAEAELDGIVQRFGKRTDIARLYLLIAASYEKAGKTAVVDRLHTLIAGAYPGTPEAGRALEGLGTSAHARGDFRRTVEVYRKLFDNPGIKIDEKIFLNYIDALYRIAEYREILAFSRSSRLSGLSTASWNLVFNYLAKSYHHLGMKKELYSLIAGEKDGIFDDESHSFFIIAALSVDDLFGAEKAMTLLPSGPHRLAGAYELASYLVNRNETQKGEPYASELANQERDQAYRSRGELLLARINLQRDSFQEAFNLAGKVTDTGLAPARDTIMTRALAAMGKEREALVFFKSRIQSILNDPASREIIPWIIESMGRNQDREGLELMSNSLQSNPDLTRSIYFYHGLIFYQQGLFPQAYYYLSQINDFSSIDSSQTYWILAEILYHFYKNEKTALTYYLKAGEKGKSPYRFRSLITLALHAAEIGRLQEARLYLETITGESPYGRYSRQAEIIRQSDSRLSGKGTEK